MFNLIQGFFAHVPVSKNCHLSFQVRLIVVEAKGHLLSYEFVHNERDNLIYLRNIFCYNILFLHFSDELPMYNIVFWH